MISLFRFLLVWYALWLVVGLGLAFYHLFAGPGSYLLTVSPTGHVEDLVFLALAAGLLGLWLAARIGVARTWILFAWIALGSAVVEWCGVHHGLPFGEYRYTGNLGPLLPGGVPVAVPLAWWVTLVPVYLAAQALLALLFFPKKKAVEALREKQPLVSVWPVRLLAVATALGAVAMDFGLEPAAQLRHYWQWNSLGPWWYDVPALNFYGWAGVSLVLALGMQALAGRPLREGFRPGGTQMLLPMLLPATVLAPFWIDLGRLPLAQAWVSWLLILWLCQTMLWTRFQPTAWARALWAGPPPSDAADNPERNRADIS